MEFLKWNRYLECRERPDPEDIRQMNTYLSRSMDGHFESIFPTLEWVQESLEITFEWEWIKDHARHLTKKQLSESDEARLGIENLIQNKINQSSYHILKEASFKLDSETGNFSFYVAKSGICLCIWANLARNPRYKSATFDDGKIKFELPRKLCMVECAVRVLKTKFDHLSQHCATFEELLVPTFSDTFPRRQDISETIEEELPWDANKSLSVSSKEEIVLDRGTSQEGMCSTANSLPDEDDVDLREYYIVGDIIHFDLLNVPPQPVFGQGWVITKVEGLQDLQCMSWLADFQPMAAISENPAEKSGKKDNEESEKEKQQLQFEKLVAVTLKLNENALWQDTPKLARWVPKRNRWNSKGFHEISYKDESFILSFRTDRFGVLGCLQPKFSVFPYQSWSLIPEYEGESVHAIFSIATTTVIIEIRVGKGYASLQQVFGNDRYILQEFYGAHHSPTKLMKMLQSVGIYLTPNKEAQKLTSNIRDKDDDLETCFYGHTALVASVFGICSSRWNGSAGKDKIIIRIKPPSMDKKASLPVVMVEARKVTMLNITEVSQNFSEKPAEDDPASADLYHLVHSIADEGIQKQLENVDSLFVDCVYQLILATRIAVCS